MSLDMHNRTHRQIVIASVIVSACFGWGGVFFLIDALVGPGGGPANILRAGLGLVLFLTAVSLLAFCALHWKSKSQDPNAASH
jgi:hypothetical protein